MASISVGSPYGLDRQNSDARTPGSSQRDATPFSSPSSSCAPLAPASQSPPTPATAPKASSKKPTSLFTEPRTAAATAPTSSTKTSALGPSGDWGLGACYAA